MPPHVQHVPIEPHTAIAQMDVDGFVTVWAACQSPYAVRQALSVAFDVPLNKLRVISPPAVGGGFGSKAGTTLEGILVPLAKKCLGRPIKLTYSREDEFENAYVRQGLHATIKTAVDKDGKITAVQNEFVWDGGAYTEYGVNIAKRLGMHLLVLMTLRMFGLTPTVFIRITLLVGHTEASVCVKSTLVLSKI